MRQGNAELGRAAGIAAGILDRDPDRHPASGQRMARGLEQCAHAVFSVERGDPGRCDLDALPGGVGIGLRAQFKRIGGGAIIVDDGELQVEFAARIGVRHGEQPYNRCPVGDDIQSPALPG